MRMALWQTEGFLGDVAANLAALERQITAAAAVGADLLICPELWLAGYHLPTRTADFAEPANGPSGQRIAELARRHGVAVVYGYAETNPAGKPFNSVQVFGRAGEPLANYRKTHLFGPMEREVFTPGDHLEAPFVFDGWSVGLLICFDIEFPENARCLTLAGMDLLLIPTAITPEYGCVPDLIVPARAVENQLHVAYCNHCGTEDGLDYLGGSCIVTPDGQALAKAGAGEALLIVDLDPTVRARLAPTFPYLRDRRPEIYRALDTL